MDNFFLKSNPLVKDYLRDTFSKSRHVAKICLIGDSGFIGNWIVFVSEILNLLGTVSIKITGLSRSEIPNSKKSKNYRHLLVKDFQGLDLNSFTHIIWGASSTSRELNYSDSNALFDLLLDKVITQKFKGFLLNLSSGAVYKNAFTPSEALTEDSPILDLKQKNISEYAKSKIYIERRILDNASKINLGFLNARLFSFCGPGMPKSAGYAMNDFFSKVISKQNITLNGNPETIRAFMHPFDLAVKIFELIIEKPSVDCLNVGSDNSQTIKFFADEISKLGHSNVILSSKARDESLKNYYPDTIKLKNYTNSANFFSTSTMLIDTIKFYQSQISLNREIGR